MLTYRQLCAIINKGDIMVSINFIISKKQFCKALEKFPHYLTDKRININGYLFNYLEFKNFILISTVYLFSKNYDKEIFKSYLKFINKVFGIKEESLKIFIAEIFGRWDYN